MKIFKHLKTLFMILNIILCCHGDLKAGYSSIQYGYRLLYRMIESYVNYSILDCIEECLRTKRCRSVNYYKGANFCELNFRRNITRPAFYRQAPGWLYTDIRDWDEVLAGSCAGPPCKIYQKCIHKPFGEYECVLSDCGIPVNKIKNTKWDVRDWEGIGIRKRMHIKCMNSFEQRGSGMIVCHKNGTWITDLVCQAKDCKGRRENDHTNSGVYEIYPFGTDPRPVRVYCDMITMGGGWTVIQKRVNGSVSFNRTWDDYKNGFGDAGQDFWIGNEVIHQLTKEKTSSLYISITLVNGSKLYELYDQFSVSNEADNYQLFLAGNASGTLGNSMFHTGSPYSDLSGMKFSTSDRDNDRWTDGNCAAYWGGGWWFNRCYHAFLNGPWSLDSWCGLWYPTVTNGTSVCETQMMIRRH